MAFLEPIKPWRYTTGHVEPMNGINKDVCGAKLQPMTVLACPVNWDCLCHLFWTHSITVCVLCSVLFCCHYPTRDPQGRLSLIEQGVTIFTIMHKWPECRKKWKPEPASGCPPSPHPPDPILLPTTYMCHSCYYSHCEKAAQNPAVLAT